MRLTEHVYLLSGFAYGLHPNVYGIDTEDGIILIDTGLDEEDYSCIRGRLCDWKLDQKPVLAVLITHAHFDHSGNAHAFRREGARICAGDGDAQGIELGDDRTIAYTYSMEFPPCQVDEILSDQQKISFGGLTFECIHVPGHSQGSMAYSVRVDGKSILFTGDFIQAKENDANQNDNRRGLKEVFWQSLLTHWMWVYAKKKGVKSDPKVFVQGKWENEFSTHQDAEYQELIGL